MTGARPGERALIEKSLAHGSASRGALESYFFVGASAIFSLLDKGNDASRYLDDPVPTKIRRSVFRFPICRALLNNGRHTSAKA